MLSTVSLMQKKSLMNYVHTKNQWKHQHEFFRERSKKFQFNWKSFSPLVYTAHYEHFGIIEFNKIFIRSLDENIFPLNDIDWKRRDFEFTPEARSYNICGMKTHENVNLHVCSTSSKEFSCFCNPKPRTQNYFHTSILIQLSVQSTRKLFHIDMSKKCWGDIFIFLSLSTLMCEI